MAACPLPDPSGMPVAACRRASRTSRGETCCWTFRAMPRCGCRALSPTTTSAASPPALPCRRQPAAASAPSCAAATPPSALPRCITTLSPQQQPPAGQVGGRQGLRGGCPGRGRCREVLWHLSLPLHEWRAPPGPRLLPVKARVCLCLPPPVRQERAVPSGIPLHRDAHQGAVRWGAVGAPLCTCAVGRGGV